MPMLASFDNLQPLIGCGLLGHKASRGLGDFTAYLFRQLLGVDVMRRYILEATGQSSTVHG